MMHLSKNFLLLGLSVVALGACSSGDDKQHWGTLDDIVVNNRGVAPATKVASTEAKLEEVKAEVNDVIDAKPKAPMTEIETKSMEAPVKAVAERGQEEITENFLEAAEKEMPEEAAQPVKEAMTEMKMDGASEPMERVEMTPPPEKRVVQAPKPASAPANSDLPPNAKPGECYAKVLIPARVAAREETVQLSEEQEVLARIVPAKYEIVRERVLIKEAQQVWKPGRGPKERVDATTGEILCLVEEPAVYKTIEKRVLIEPERPEYKTIPAQFDTITHTEVIEAERLEWRRILCETNVTPAVLMSIQRALNAKGYNAGPVDGKYGRKTMTAVDQYQRRNGLATNGLTYETIEHMGIKLAGM